MELIERRFIIKWQPHMLDKRFAVARQRLLKNARGTPEPLHPMKSRIPSWRGDRLVPVTALAQTSSLQRPRRSAWVWLGGSRRPQRLHRPPRAPTASAWGPHHPGGGLMAASAHGLPVPPARVPQRMPGFEMLGDLNPRDPVVGIKSFAPPSAL
jgi:hypothetical protein